MEDVTKIRVFQDTDGWIVLQISDGEETRGTFARLDRRGARRIGRLLRKASRTRSPVPTYGLEV